MSRSATGCRDSLSGIKWPQRAVNNSDRSIAMSSIRIYGTRIRRRDKFIFMAKQNPSILEVNSVFITKAHSRRSFRNVWIYSKLTRLVVRGNLCELFTQKLKFYIKCLYIDTCEGYEWSCNLV